MPRPSLASNHLKNVLQSELHNPRICRGRDLPKQRTRERAVRIVRFRVIQCVECFRSELDLLTFGDREGADQRQVDVERAGANKNASRSVAVLAGSVRYEGCRIEPLRQRPRAEAGTCSNVRALIAGAGESKIFTRRNTE